MKKIVIGILLFSISILYPKTSIAQNTSNKNIRYVLKKQYFADLKTKYNARYTTNPYPDKGMFVYKSGDAAKTPLLDLICQKKIYAHLYMKSGNQPVLDIYTFTTRDSLPDTQCSELETNGALYELNIDRNSVYESTYVYKLNYRGLNWGVLTLPFRIRFKAELNNKNNEKKEVDIVADKSFSFGLYAGPTWGKVAITSRGFRHIGFTPVWYLGVGIADLKQSSYKDPLKYHADLQNPTLNYGFGIMANRNNFGLIVTGGWESMMGQNHNEWVYQNKFNIGIGLTASLGIF